MNVRPLLDQYKALTMDALGRLSVERQQLVDTALGEGAGLEMRITIRDQLPTVTLGLSNLDGAFHELARLDIEMH